MIIKSFFLIILIITFGVVLAEETPTKPYELTENDIFSILELSVELGIDSNKPINVITANQVLEFNEKILVNINFKPDKKRERAERIISLNCELSIYKDWECRKSVYWRLFIKGEEALTVMAHENFEKHSINYLQVLDLVTNEIGTETRYGKISRISRNGFEYEIIFGSRLESGCTETVVIHKIITELEPVWSIKGDQNIVMCV